MENKEGYYDPDDPKWNWGQDIAPYRREEASPKKEDHIFEIGLVMAGAISAGSYSAGVLDYLIEALDAWEKAKAEGKDVPRHQVRIKVIAGASAGGMNAAIAASAFNYDYPHMRPGINPSTITNPFYDGWVKDISLAELLEDNDIKRTGVVTSLLDCTVLQKITNKALNYTATEIDRPYLRGRVRYIFTQSSLKGLPYYCAFPGNGESGMEMTLHKTWRSFSVNYDGHIPVMRRPDDLPLTAGLGYKSSIAGWVELGNAALASGAYPFALAPRLETREVDDLDWRFVVTTGADGKTPEIVQLLPAWKKGPNVPVNWPEFIIDGGMMDNEPLELARTEMSGLNHSSPRAGLEAFRSVIMIDPFPQAAPVDFPASASPLSLLDSLSGIVTTALHQLRFNAADLTLALDKDVYSRFLIAPVRSQNGKILQSNDMAIASGSLGGFGGFLHQDFRHHDYMLGRRNCQQFLRANFSLPYDNSLFKAGGNNRPVPGKEEYPIIPLPGNLETEEPLPAWPANPVELDVLSKQLDARAKLVIVEIFKTKKMSGFTGWLIRLALRFGSVRMKAINPLVEWIKKDLSARKLPYQ